MAAESPRDFVVRNDSSCLRTTLGSFLCSALRDELEVDCVLFDGGNIRGDLATGPRALCSLTCANDVYMIKGHKRDIFIISDNLVF